MGELGGRDPPPRWRDERLDLSRSSGPAGHRHGAGFTEIADPLLVKDLDQDTLQREIGGDGTVKLMLNCFEALPRFDKPTGRKWSHESQIERYPGDYGLALTSRVAKSGQPIDWRQG